MSFTLTVMMRCKMGGWWSNSMPVALTMDSFKCSHGVTFLDYIPCLYLIGESLSSAAFWLISPQGALTSIVGHSSIVTTLEFIIIMLIVIVSNCNAGRQIYLIYQGRTLRVILGDSVRWLRESRFQMPQREIDNSLNVWEFQVPQFSFTSKPILLTQKLMMMMMARMSVCTLCVRLFGCLHSWEDGRGRRSDNTRQSHYFTGLTGNKCSQHC